MAIQKVQISFKSTEGMLRNLGAIDPKIEAVKKAEQQALQRFYKSEIQANQGQASVAKNIWKAVKKIIALK